MNPAAHAVTIMARGAGWRRAARKLFAGVARQTTVDDPTEAPALLDATDETLVERALDGSARAWQRLIARYERRLFNHALRLTGHREDAIDLTQDILLAVYRNLHTFRGESAFAAWLFRIARYRCTDHLRRRRSHEPFEEESEQFRADPRDEPEDAATAHATNRRLLRAMARLPEEQRLVVELKFFQQFTFEDIAEQVGISPNTAKTRLYTALRKLRGDTDLEAIADAL